MSLPAEELEAVSLKNMSSVCEPFASSCSRASWLMACRIWVQLSSRKSPSVSATLSSSLMHSTFFSRISRTVSRKVNLDSAL